MAKIKVNDEVQEVSLPLTLTELLQLNNVRQPDMVSVQINGQHVERQDFDAAVINEGDEVDFLFFMGGGQR